VKYFAVNGSNNVFISSSVALAVMQIQQRIQGLQPARKKLRDPAERQALTPERQYLVQPDQFAARQPFWERTGCTRP
jgi:hypothetical protein